MKAIDYNTLDALATHLETGKLGHKRFNLRVFNQNFDGRLQVDPEPYTCGTNGCAIGELPIIFPQRYAFGREGVIVSLATGWPVHKHEVYDSLGLDSYEFETLFFPNSYAPHQRTGAVGRKAVAIRIRELLVTKTIDE